MLYTYIKFDWIKYLLKLELYFITSIYSLLSPTNGWSLLCHTLVMSSPSVTCQTGPRASLCKRGGKIKHVSSLSLVWREIVSAKGVAHYAITDFQNEADFDYHQSVRSCLKSLLGQTDFLTDCIFLLNRHHGPKTRIIIFIVENCKRIVSFPFWWKRMTSHGVIRFNSANWENVPTVGESNLAVMVKYYRCYGQR